MAAAGAKRWTGAVPALLCLVGLLIDYGPALGGDYIWDDPEYVVENPVLERPGGLASIWLDVTATPQYYPLVHTSFWIERRLWGLDPRGYHVVNVLLHGLGAGLFWRLLHRLGIAGAGPAAALFAFHPVMVESVAWITERKNVLSLVFYLAAFLVYWPLVGAKLDSRGRRGRYLASLLLFAGALFAKSVSGSWPAAVLLCAWWRHGRFSRGDLARLAPFFALALASGALTIHLERTHVGAEGSVWDLSLAERLLVAGRAFWFYLGKLAWPASLAFVYPRWDVAQASAWQYAYPTGALAALALAWAGRRRLGRGPAAALFFFGGTLFPALGFFDVYPMRFSYVADHFQYHASLGAFAWAGAALARVTSPRGAGAVAAALGVALGIATHAQAGMYRDVETLWKTTLERNPRAWIAHQNLGALYVERGERDRARGHYEAALAIEPDLTETLYNYSTLIAGLEGRRGEAIACLRRALELRPDNYPAAHNLGFYLLDVGATEEARAAFRQGLHGAPFDARLWLGIGLAHARDGDAAEAREAWSRARAADPAFYAPWLEEGAVLERQGARAQAALCFDEAAVRAPDPARRDEFLSRARALRQEQQAEASHGR